MNIADEVQNRLKKFSKHAKDTFDYAKMEIKIKAYGRECKKRYTRIGMLMYESRKRGSVVNGDEIENICKEIDKFKHKIKVIQRQIDDLKADDDIIDEYEKNCDSDNYNALEKKDNDLKISRTENGIKFLKFCPKCDVGNEPNSSTCSKCGYKFE